MRNFVLGVIALGSFFVATLASIWGLGLLDDASFLPAHKGANNNDIVLVFLMAGACCWLCIEGMTPSEDAK